MALSDVSLRCHSPAASASVGEQEEVPDLEVPDLEGRLS